MNLLKNELPEAWCKTSFADIADIGTGNPAPQGEQFFNNGIYPFVRVQDMGRLGMNKYVTDTADHINELAIKKLKHFPKGTVLFTKSGASSLLNQRALLKSHMYVVSHIATAVPFDGISSDYLYYWLKTVDFNHIAHATTLPSIALSKVCGIEISLASTEEQNQIVSVLEEFFSDLDNAIENIKRAQEQLKVYRRAVLKYAFIGKLLNDGNVWETKPLGQVCHVVSGNTPKGVNEIYSMGEIPFYKVSDMNTEGNEVYLRKSKINLSANDCKKLKLKTYPAGTVVFPKRGGAILTNKKRILSKESAFDLNLMGVVSNDNVLERFLFNWFLLLDLGKLCDGSNVPQINHGDIEPLDFPFVPTEVQEKVIGEIEARLSVCKNMEDALDENLCKAEALRQSILKQAFEGKLTEQWRKEHKDLISGENSAEALLKKIKAEKEALQAKPKGKKKHD